MTLGNPSPMSLIFLQAFAAQDNVAAAMLRFPLRIFFTIVKRELSIARLEHLLCMRQKDSAFPRSRNDKTLPKSLFPLLEITVMSIWSYHLLLGASGVGHQTQFWLADPSN